MSRADESAFPGMATFEKYDDELGRYVDVHYPTGGITMREHFAAMAMQGMLANSECRTWDVSDDAVRAADALLAELAKKPGGA